MTTTIPCYRPYLHDPRRPCVLPIDHDGPHVTRDGRGWHDSDDMDGGVTCALIEKETEDFWRARWKEAADRADARDLAAHQWKETTREHVGRSRTALSWAQMCEESLRTTLARAEKAEKERDEAVERAEKHRRAEVDHRNNARCWMKTSEGWQAIAEEWEKRATEAEKERDEAHRHEGVAAEQATEQARNAWEAIKERDEAVRVWRQSLGVVATQPRPLTPEDITDEMLERAAVAVQDATSDIGGYFYVDAARAVLEAALTEPAQRPEGAEEIEAWLDGMPESIRLDGDEHQRLFANHLAHMGFRVPVTLAERGVRVVTEERS